ncbi:hypothetical protein Nmel_016366 [Mimus melanotis]
MINTKETFHWMMMTSKHDSIVGILG